jgi:hypothetical protein
MGVKRMNDIISVIAIMCILLLIGDYFLRRKLNVLKNEKMSPGARRFENIGVTIIIIGYLLISIPLITQNRDINIVWIIFPLFIMVSAFRAFLEWRYNRHARKWAMEIYSIITFSVIVAVLLLLG